MKQLFDEEQQALIILLDSLVARAILRRLMGESQKLRRSKVVAKNKIKTAAKKEGGNCVLN